MCIQQQLNLILWKQHLRRRKKMKKKKLLILLLVLLGVATTGVQKSFAKTVDVGTRGSIRFIIDEDGDDGSGGSGGSGGSTAPGGGGSDGNSSGGSIVKPGGNHSSGQKPSVYPPTGEKVVQGISIIGLIVVGVSFWMFQMRKKRN